MLPRSLAVCSIIVGIVIPRYLSWPNATSLAYYLIPYVIILGISASTHFKFVCLSACLKVLSK